MEIILSIAAKNPYMFLNYMGGIKNHQWKKQMSFKLIVKNEDYVQAQY